MTSDVAKTKKTKKPTKKTNQELIKEPTNNDENLLKPMIELEQRNKDKNDEQRDKNSKKPRRLKSPPKELTKNLLENPPTTTKTQKSIDLLKKR
ncbi:hypothetical protein C2G38_2218877 [Gigaspora rosea]|uniref:Uncharacterized protein n=1 Tax=Gigaspora rosea TaxID=44941 RepID=A0A397U9J9_9GLOM|nr:hypothetical protein C2G38_2218877 [Gigaspora rosea]